MKKVLSVLGLIAILGLASPVMAAPPGPGGPGGHGGGGRPPMHGPHLGPHIRTGHHGHHIRPHGGFTVHAGHPRHGYWRHHGFGYWSSNRCNYRLGWCDYPIPYYYPVSGMGFSISF